MLVRRMGFLKALRPVLSIPNGLSERASVEIVLLVLTISMVAVLDGWLVGGSNLSLNYRPRPTKNGAF